MARLLIRFVVGVTLTYALLVSPWPGFRRAYAVAFRAGCKAWTGPVGDNGFVRLLPPDPGRPRTVRFLLQKRGAPAPVEVGVTDRHTGFLPTALFVALALGAPLPWSRRWRALLVGLPVLVAFTAVRVAVAVHSVFLVSDAVALVSIGPTGRWIVSKISLVLLRWPLVSFTAPLVLWVLVTFRAEDVELLRRRAEAPRGPRSRG